MSYLWWNLKFCSMSNCSLRRKTNERLSHTRESIKHLHLYYHRCVHRCDTVFSNPKFCNFAAHCTRKVGSVGMANRTWVLLQNDGSALLGTRSREMFCQSVLLRRCILFESLNTSSWDLGLGDYKGGVLNSGISFILRFIKICSLIEMLSRETST
jgi:hypothetical protein